MFSLFSSMFSNIGHLVMSAVITFIALTFHELAHGWVSMKLGDPTPRIQGRMTLNPLAHLDPIGTILMVLTGFGWAKPVEVNSMYYKDRKKGMALVGIAGPVTNLLLAIVGAVIWILPFVIASGANLNLPSVIANGYSYFMYLFIFRNLCFMVFNLIPIPPLDGSRVIGMFLKNSTYYRLMSYERYSFFLILILSLTGVFDNIIGTGVNFFFNLIFGTVMRIFGVLV